LSEWNDPEFTRHPLYIVGDVLTTIWEVVLTILSMLAGHWRVQLWPNGTTRNSHGAASSSKRSLRLCWYWVPFCPA